MAGKYRLIDIPISNCLNSGINRIYVLTQFNSVSLHRHIRQTYQFDHFDGGFVEILAAQQTNEASDWYQGTADAVRKQLRYIEQPDIQFVLVLSGDQLYRMDYGEMLETHLREKADVTIAALPVTREAARGFGIMRIDEKGRVVGFLEKPKTPKEFELIRSDPTWLDARGIASRGRDCLASMGIYLFNRETLVELLSKSDYQDFGKEVFPMSIRARRVQMYPFDGYWEDIGTIRSFYQANLDLARVPPPFDFESKLGPIYTHARSLPPARIDGATISQSLLADGCIIEPGARIERSVIGLRCHIGRNVVDSRLDPHGGRLLPDCRARPTRKNSNNPFWEWARGARFVVPSSTRTARSAKTCTSNASREPGRRRLRQCLHSRRNHCRAQGGRALRRLAVPPTRLDSIAGPGAPPHPHQGRVKLLKSRPFIYFGSVNAFGSALSSTLNSVIS